MKMKISLSFRGAASGGTDQGILRNVQVSLNLPHNVYSEQSLFKFSELNFGRSATPPVV